MARHPSHPFDALGRWHKLPCQLDLAASEVDIVVKAEKVVSIGGLNLSGKPCSTLAFEKRWNRVLSMDRDAFVAHVSRAVAAPPSEVDTILRFNQGRSP